jgi:hypothetical protein
MEPVEAGNGSNSSPADDRKASPKGYDHERGLGRRSDIPREGRKEGTARRSPQERLRAQVVHPEVRRQSSL